MIQTECALELDQGRLGAERGWRGGNTVITWVLPEGVRGETNAGLSLGVHQLPASGEERSLSRGHTHSHTLTHILTYIP